MPISMKSSKVKLS